MLKYLINEVYVKERNIADSNSEIIGLQEFDKGLRQYKNLKKEKQKFEA
jgi:hypothetical protein